METIRIGKSIITKVGADLAKEYVADASNYNELIHEMWRDDAPHDAVEEYLVDEGLISEGDDLKNHISASDYIVMLAAGEELYQEYFTPYDFEMNFNVWFCEELKERLEYYNFDLDAPVDVDAMVRMAESEKQKGR
jgi:hypothetical protein